MTIDYVRLPFAEAVIEKVDGAKNWDVRMVDGYPLPDEELSRPFWPIQVYDAQPWVRGSNAQLTGCTSDAGLA